MDIQLFYQEKGSGVPMLLLHGNGEDGSYFKYQIEHFSKDYRVIAVDTRGHGKSPRGTAPFSMRQFADDLYSFMDQQKLEQAILLGFSDGANIAMQFAIQYPNKVKLLILNGGNLNAGGIKRSTQFPIEIGYKIAGKFAEKSAAAKKNAELLGLMVEEPNIEPSELKAISVPTLVIAGTRDIVKEQHTVLIAESIPNAELIFIKGGHFIARKQPEAFNQEVECFLKKYF